MSRNQHDLRSPSPALERARTREQARKSHHATLSGVPPTLDIQVDDLAEGGIDIDTVLPGEAVTALLDEGKEIEWTAAADARVKLRLEREAGLVRARGSARFALRHPCVRCLNPVPFDVPLDVDLRLAKSEGAAEGKPFDEEGAEGDIDSAPGGEIEDIGVASYAGDTIHLADVLREQLFLELPMHPACDSPRARPTDPCAFDASGALKQEQERWADPRWAALAKLKEQLAVPPAAPAAVPLPGHDSPVALPGRRTSPPAPAPGRPAAAKAKPAAKKAKLAAKKAKPAVKKAKPVAKKAKPAAKKAKPAAKKAKPVAKKAKPAAKRPKASKAPAKKVARKKRR